MINAATSHAKLWACRLIIVQVRKTWTFSIFRVWTHTSLWNGSSLSHYSDVIMGDMASQIIGVTIVYLTVCPGADQRKHQSSASLAFAWNSPVIGEFPHKRPVTWTMFPFDDVIIWDILPKEREIPIRHVMKRGKVSISQIIATGLEIWGQWILLAVTHSSDQYTGQNMLRFLPSSYTPPHPTRLHPFPWVYITSDKPVPIAKTHWWHLPNSTCLFLQ